MLWNNVDGIVCNDVVVINVELNSPWAGSVISRKRFAGIVEMVE